MLLLGSSGMLGGEIANVLKQEPKIEVLAVNRSTRVEGKEFSAGESNINVLLEEFRPNYVLNAIGIIKQKEVLYKSREIETEMQKVNSKFPHMVAESCLETGAAFIQIATDCVFSGERGPYDEFSPHDAIDNYGKSKSAGEVNFPNSLNIRCSIIGTEKYSSYSLWSWLLSQPEKASIHGYTNHLWNGVTTKTFAQMLRGLIMQRHEISGTYHLVPRDYVSKFELLKILADKNQRGDLNISEYSATPAIDRRLNTQFKDVNELLWKCAGYRYVPSIEEVIKDH